MSYKTVYKEAEAEQVIQRSRFITHVSPVDSYEEAQAYVAMIKEEYKDATHNVPAVVIGEKQELQWMSDDGEPQGTSGPPILRMLVEEGLTNLVVVVTRYFGGVKLGTGGLVRAYSGSAKLGLEAAGICTVTDGYVMEYLLDYSHLAKINNAEQQGDFHIVHTEYMDKVKVTIGCKTEVEGLVIKTFNDITSGTCELLSKKNEKISEKIVDSN